MCSNRIAIRLKHFALAVIYSVGTTVAVSAQTNQDASSSVEATLVPGSTVWITDFTGHEEKTRITGVSGASSRARQVNKRGVFERPTSCGSKRAITPPC